MAYSDPVARRGMRTGAVPEDWAQREHSAWAAELTDRVEPLPGAIPQNGTGSDANLAN